MLQGRLEIFPGRSVLGSAWVFWGRYTAQVAPQTAPYGMLLQTELQNSFSINLRQAGIDIHGGKQYTRIDISVL